MTRVETLTVASPIMGQLLLDETLRARLNGLNERMEVRDRGSRPIGHFLPDRDYRQLLYANDQCPYSPDQIREHVEESGGRTLAEIWSRLGR